MLSSGCESQQRLIELIKEREYVNWQASDLKPEFPCLPDYASAHHAVLLSY